MSARWARPSIAEVRAVGQPPSLFERSEESWSGRLYLRRVSPHLTRLLVPTRVNPDAVTCAMIVSGVLAAAVLAEPGVITALAAVVLIQVQILLDCVDGELARWRRRFSPADRVSARGVYLDHVGHYLTLPLLAVGLGIRADGGWNSIGPYTTLGLVVAFLALFVSASGALVYVTRAESGLGPPGDRGDFTRSRSSLLQRARRAAGRMPFYRALVAMEFTLLALAASVVDAIAGDRVGSRALVIAMIPVAGLTVLGRLAAILTSDRLR